MYRNTNSDTKSVTVLLTKYSDWISCLIYYIGGRGYTHASLSLDDNQECFYSFNYKGFCIETLAKHRRRGVKKSLSYEIQIPIDAYEEISQRISVFIKNQKQYHYTKLGVLFAVLQIPFKWKKHYICSQFVAELLKDTGAVPLKKSASTYLPNHFCKELEQFPSLQNIMYQCV